MGMSMGLIGPVGFPRGGERLSWEWEIITVMIEWEGGCCFT